MELITESMRQSCDIIAVREGDKLVVRYSKIQGISEGKVYEEDSNYYNDAKRLNPSAKALLVEPIFE